MQQLEHPADASDYLDALYKLKGAKNWLLVVLLIVLAGNLAAALTLRLTTVLDGSASLQADLAAVRGEAPAGDPVASRPAEAASRPAPATPPTADGRDDDEAAPFETIQTARQDKPFPADSESGPPLVDGEQIYTVLAVGLPVARAVGLPAAVLLAAVLLVTVTITLLGRLSGVAYLTSALLWSLLLAVMLVPWNLAFEGFGLPGALFSGDELVEGTARAMATAETGWAVQLVYWLRFVAYPGAALGVWLAILIQYRRGFRPLAAGASA